MPVDIKVNTYLPFIPPSILKVEIWKLLEEGFLLKPVTGTTAAKSGNPTEHSFVMKRGNSSIADTKKVKKRVSGCQCT